MRSHELYMILESVETYAIEPINKDNCLGLKIYFWDNFARDCAIDKIEKLNNIGEYEIEKIDESKCGRFDVCSFEIFLM